MSFRPFDAPPVAFQSDLRRHEHHGLTLDAPSDWEDEALLTLSPPGPAPKPVLTVVRQSVAPTASLELIVSRRIAQVAEHVAGLEVEGVRPAVVAGQHGIAVRMSWEELDGRILQALLFAKVNDEVFIVCGTCVEGQVGRMMTAFDRVAGSLRLGGSPRAVR